VVALRLINGWSEKGADQMARLRAFKYNGGGKDDIRDLLE